MNFSTSAGTGCLSLEDLLEDLLELESRAVAMPADLRSGSLAQADKPTKFASHLRPVATRTRPPLISLALCFMVLYALVAGLGALESSRSAHGFMNSTSVNIHGIEGATSLRRFKHSKQTSRIW